VREREREGRRAKEIKKVRMMREIKTGGIEKGEERGKCRLFRCMRGMAARK
jgi:hypothetical protein